MSLSIEFQDFEKAPIGNWVARCFGIIDIGHQYNAKYDQSHPKVILQFELLDTETRAKDGSPITVNKIYSAYMSEKAHLRRDMESWRGKAFGADEKDAFLITKVAGQFALLNIVHSEDGKWANIEGVTAIPKQMRENLPAAVNKILLFDLNDHTKEQLEALPNWMQQKIAGSEEFRQNTSGQPDGTEPPLAAPDGEEFDDDLSDIPF